MEILGCLFWGFVLILGLADLNVSGASSSKMSRVAFDASDITWAHAVNSREQLERALAGPIDFLEADISLGHLSGQEQSMAVPIMAHPPDTTSDITLDTWLDTVLTKRPQKGIKLDFKSLAVVEPSLIILQKYSSKLNSVWLNADVLSGPINSPKLPVSVEHFLSLCRQYSPNSTLSIGWTTDLPPDFTQELAYYNWQHVREMADVIRCQGYDANYPNITFPVRALFAARSIRQLRWLLAVVPNSTLTVWNGKYDPLQLYDLLHIRKSFPKDKVFYDLLEKIDPVFQGKKNTVDVPDLDVMADDGQWTTLTRGQGGSCSTLTYVSNDSIMFGKMLTTAVLRKNVISLADKGDLKVTGKIKFFHTKRGLLDLMGGEAQELKIIFADVSLFSKNTSSSSDSRKELDLTMSDSEVIWSAINSSTIYTFRHKYAEEDKSCRFFKLDTSEDKSFEVWTVPCDEMLEKESLEDISRNAIPEISSRKRLVIPKSPFMLGFVSAGNEHVVIYDLKIKYQGEHFTSGSTSSMQATLGIFSVTVSLLFMLFLVL